MISYRIDIDDDLQLIRVEVSGVVTKNTGKEIITKARVAASEHGYDILYDIRRATIKVSTTSWFNLPRELDVFNHEGARLIKAAILIEKEDKAIDEYLFFENVVRNLGFSFKVHFSETEALRWLDRIH